MTITKHLTDTKIARKLASTSYGYTIIEVIVFLTVSTALFLSVSTMMSGRNDRTRFSQAVVDLDENLQDIFNDVSVGYFPSNSKIKCTTYYDTWERHNLPILQSVGNQEQGSNGDCIFAGKLVSMPVSDFTGGNKMYNKYFIHTMVSAEDADFDKMNCTLLLGGVGKTGDLTAVNPGVREERDIQYQLQVTKLLLKNPRAANSVNRSFNSNIITGFASVPDFAGEEGLNKSKTGNSSRSKLYAYKGESTTSHYPSKEDFFPIEGTNTITICLAQDGNGRKAALVISANQTIERFIDNTPSECS